MLVAPRVWLWPAIMSTTSPVRARPFSLQQLLAAGHHLVGGGREFGAHRHHAPPQGQPPVGLLVVGQGGDGRPRAVAREQPRGGARFREGHDQLAVELLRHRVRHPGQAARHQRALAARHARGRAQAVVLLGVERDARHGGHRLHREPAGGRLAGEHDPVRAVEDRVGHVGGLGARGPRVLDHALQHLRGGDHHLARGVGHLDDPLLQRGHLLGGQLHARGRRAPPSRRPPPPGSRPGRPPPRASRSWRSAGALPPSSRISALAPPPRRRAWRTNESAT